MAAYDLRDLTQGAAVQTTLTIGISNIDTTITIDASTNWPSGGGNGNFFIVINRGGSTEEKIECSARSSVTLTVAGGVAGRGKDGTSAAAHIAGEPVEITYTARDFAEANYTVAKTIGKATAVGQILVVDAANSFAAVQAKTAGNVLLGNGTSLVSQAVTGDVTINGSGVTAIGSGKVTAAMLAAGVGGDGFTEVRKSADESVTSSASLQNDDHLFFTAANGTAYIIEVFLIYASPAGAGTPDILVDVAEDGTTRGAFGQSGSINDSEAALSAGVLAGQGVQAAVFGTAATKRLGILRGGYVGAGGTFRVRWAQNTPSGNATTVYAGSLLRYKALA